MASAEEFAKFVKETQAESPGGRCAGCHGGSETGLRGRDRRLLMFEDQHPKMNRMCESNAMRRQDRRFG